MIRWVAVALFALTVAGVSYIAGNLGGEKAGKVEVRRVEVNICRDDTPRRCRALLNRLLDSASPRQRRMLRTEERQRRRFLGQPDVTEGKPDGRRITPSEPRKPSDDRRPPADIKRPPAPSPAPQTPPQPPPPPEPAPEPEPKGPLAPVCEPLGLDIPLC
jgi:hypothetical protein